MWHVPLEQRHAYAQCMGVCIYVGIMLCVGLSAKSVSEWLKQLRWERMRMEQHFLIVAWRAIAACCLLLAATATAAPTAASANTMAPLATNGRKHTHIETNTSTGMAAALSANTCLAASAWPLLLS